MNPDDDHIESYNWIPIARAPHVTKRGPTSMNDEHTKSFHKRELIRSLSNQSLDSALGSTIELSNVTTDENSIRADPLASASATPTGSKT